MSNFLAIATVTAVLKKGLLEVIQTAIPGAEVTTVRPDRQGSGGTPGQGINIFLYQVSLNGALRNADLPMRRASGELINLPQVALNLDYLLSFYGSDLELQQQRLLGIVIRSLHTRPQITRTMVNGVITDSAFSFLAASDLAEQVESVKFVPLSLSLEDLSKLWSVFFQVPFVLSVAYRASVVLIEPDFHPQPTLPVRDFRLYTIPFGQPSIEQIGAGQGVGQPIFSSSTLTIQGNNLSADITKVRISGAELMPIPQEISSKQIRLPLSLLPSGQLRAGIQSVQVIHQILMGTPSAPHNGAESNVAAFILHPLITSLHISGSQVAIQTQPNIGESQRAILLLNEFNPPASRSARSYLLESLPHSGTEPEPIIFDQSTDDPAFTELGLNTSTQVWGSLSGDLSGFSGLTNDPAMFMITIGGEGPHEVRISGPLADLDAVTSALQAGIRSAHTSASFLNAEVARVDNKLLVLPGVKGEKVIFYPSGNDPALTELGLEDIIQMAGSLSGNLAGFAGLTNRRAKVLMKVGKEGFHKVIITGDPGTLDAASSSLQAGIRNAHSSLLFKDAMVARVGDHLLVMHGIKSIIFPVSGVEPAEYLVRVQVDGAQSPLKSDGTGRYLNPRITIV